MFASAKVCVSPVRRDLYQKLYKISRLDLLVVISPNVIHTRIKTILESLISTWCIGSIFALAFQCNLPKPRNSINGVCHDRAAFWRSVAALNIITDIALVALQVVMMRNLQMSLKKRLIVLSCFGSRGLLEISSSLAYN
ncbi:e8905f50-b32e-4ff6-b4b1-9f5601b63a41 [Sclerotinia trifoliorum]|uniref:E8905f50-b32e-4ff6-b4b1-9f5601b63a41 n=1 Tax=Sclerotinia trifoliorum TaxID=28548 RepID=A0A8H2ZT21_9HELO|nr:e8905f50-b32e-4ff6-b4b1-9f5601b63a41 [Sclerotinia trifoliorum]